jgi:hypothetical protein
MKRGIELLNARTAEEPFSNKALLDNGILLPPIFLAFIQCVQTGDFYGFFKLEKGAEFEQDHPFPYLTTIKSGEGVPIIDCLFNEEQIVQAFEPELDYVSIGYFGSEVCLVGNQAWNMDMVVKHRFSERTPTDPSFEKIADNIFAYFNAIEEAEYIVNEENKEQYFKNWGEDFWRVRDFD